MSAGKMEQVGPPFEIYNFPKTQFVASFVGTLNQLPCTVVDAARGLLAYDSQHLTTASTIDVPQGSKVRVMLRPEELHFDREEENRLTGQVKSVTFLGSIVRVEVSLGDATVTLDALNERKLTLPQVGDSQIVSFPPHACWVMPEGQEKL
jgi:putative spermidine/putrescine transport system ATP-binding protein